MAWIRLSDDYMDHPKFAGLSDGAFRLWHRGMSYSRKYQTDGLLSLSTVRAFKEYSPKRVSVLSTPHQDGANALWQTVEGFGFKVHDYLDWNPSKDEENERKAESKERMRQFRGRRSTDTVTPPLQRNAMQTNALVLERRGDTDLDSSPKEEKDSDEMRAGRLVENYGEWFRQRRHGARHRVRPHLDYQDALTLVRTWDDERLEKLAAIVLTTDDAWISGTDRSFKIFAMKATWADERLATWEAKQGRAS